jgi:hypothetical protein
MSHLRLYAMAGAAELLGDAAIGERPRAHRMQDSALSLLAAAKEGDLPSVKHLVSRVGEVDDCTDKVRALGCQLATSYVGNGRAVMQHMYKDPALLRVQRG